MKFLFLLLFVFPLFGSDFNDSDSEQDPVERLIKFNQHDISITRTILKDRIKVADQRVAEFESYLNPDSSVGFRIEYMKAQFHKEGLKDLVQRLKEQDGK